MASPVGYLPVEGTERQRRPDHKQLATMSESEPIQVTMIVRRRPDGSAKRMAEGKGTRPISRDEFRETHGADPNELNEVASFATSLGLTVIESNPSRRAVVVRGKAADFDRAFGVTLHDYQTPTQRYHGHEGSAFVPKELAGKIEAIIGLDNQQVPAVHHAVATAMPSADPANTQPLTPMQVASLYNFPAGTGQGQTIGIYEMATSDGPPGFAAQDVADTMNGFGGGLTVPKPIAVEVDGQRNSGTSDAETLLDITVSAAIAQQATIAVYFTKGSTQGIIRALQTMIHPTNGDPVPTVISISYGWGPDDSVKDGISKREYQEMDQLFQDAQSLAITVLVSSGDSGAQIASQTDAQASFPATDPWVTACGGTTIGNVSGAAFTEYVWNDVGAGGPGATGGGISARFPIPTYQSGLTLPVQNVTNKPGRGIPDLAGNASENSGYPLSMQGQSQPVGGTSAVAPLYAGLIAVINSNLGSPSGFINPIIYGAGATAFRPISGPPGPANNSFGAVTGYPASAGWNACTGLGSVNGTALQAAIQAAKA